jgi:ABC-2 type transport system permease protein
VSTLAVARKDFQDALRSRVLLALLVLFALFAIGGVYLFSEVIDLGSAQGITPAIQLITSLLQPISIFVPLIGVMAGYKAVVGERESGSVKLLLSLPHTRRDVVFGKLAGRIAVLAVAILVGFALAGGVAIALYDSFPVAAYAGFVGLTLLLGVAYLAFAIGLSASTGSGSVALWGSLGFFVLFQFLWGLIVDLLVYVANGFATPEGFAFLLGYFPPGQAPNWYRLLKGISPGTAYQRAVGTVLPESAPAASGSTPYFLADWFGIVVLAIWVIVPLVFGYLGFKKADL